MKKFRDIFQKTVYDFKDFNDSQKQELMKRFDHYSEKLVPSTLV